MPLTTAERKHRMPFGAQREVSAELRIDPGYISKVMNDEIRRPKTPGSRKKLRRVQVALARKLGMRVDEAFPESDQESAPMARAS